jgi:hypothetical protein
MSCGSRFADEGLVKNKAVDVALALNPASDKRAWSEQSEGAKFWLKYSMSSRCAGQRYHDLRWSAGLRDFWKRGQVPHRRRAGCLHLCTQGVICRAQRWCSMMAQPGAFADRRTPAGRTHRVAQVVAAEVADFSLSMLISTPRTVSDVLSAPSIFRSIRPEPASYRCVSGSCMIAKSLTTVPAAFASVRRFPRCRSQPLCPRSVRLRVRHQGDRSVPAYARSMAGARSNLTILSG